MRTHVHRVFVAIACATAMSGVFASRANALEVLCDTAFENCRTRLLGLIDNEQVAIDVGFWVMEDQRYVSHLVNRKNAGVRIRVIMDPRSIPTYPLNQTTFDALQNAGIPMMKKSGGGIMHWKTMIFAGQNTVEFGAANYSDNEFVPVAPYTNYISESIYYTDDPSIVNSFKTKFDDLWVNASTYSAYANVSDRVRSYPTFPISPDLNIPPGQSFATRVINLENAERQQIDVAMYRITQQSHGDALIAAFRRGIPVRYIGETREYRLASRLWVSYNMDRIYAAGVPMRVRAHDGLNHQKLVLLYGQGMSVFGSSNFTSPSDNSQQEHNYFTTKSWMFQWFQEQYDRQWNNSTGNIETAPFVPLPPDKPVYHGIADQATGVPTTGQQLVWYGGPWAHLYDIYFGTDPAATTLLVGDQQLGPSATTTQNQSFALPTLQPGTTYYWKIVSKTMARLEKSGPISRFTTAGTAPPPPPPPSGAATIVLWTSHTQAADIHGNWSMLTDTTASGGAALRNPDAGQSKISPALATPANYFERTFSAYHGVAYHLWVRLKAQNNALGNDSVHVQFSGSVGSTGSPMWRINTTSSAEVILQNGSSDPSDTGWGWADSGWGTPGVSIYFAADGAQTVRVQQREDGAIVDEIVLSPDTYVSSPPGPRDNDATILTENDGSGSPPPPPPPPSNSTIVLWTARAPSSGIVGSAWQLLTDGTAAGGSALWNPDGAQPKISPALAAPSSYVEMTFNATAGVPYHLWVRLRAQNNSFSNDSLHVQFDDSVDASGRATMRTGSNSSAEVVLQDGPSGSADHGWGWADNGWGVLGVNVYFATTGVQTLRIQQREDGPIVDQIVLSPDAYLTTPPGPRQDDATILNASQ